MASWRDTVDAATQSDLDTLFAAAPGFAASRLESGGTFIPYAAHMDLEGTVGLMAADIELAGPGADAARLITTLSDVLAINNDQLRGSAIVSDVTTASGDAISVHLEHRDGVSIRIVIPYTRTDTGAEVADPAGVEELPAVVFA